MRTARFSLVELMIVVAIIAVLAAIAIPAFASMQARARFAEALPNIHGIATQVQVYAEEHPNTTLSGAANPRSDSALNRSLVNFDSTAAGWSALNWQPDGAVRCNYAVAINYVSPPGNFTAAAVCDVDYNGMDHECGLQATLGQAFVQSDICRDSGGSPGTPPCY